MTIPNNAALLKALAAEHDVPDEIAEALSVLMERYPDLSQWGSRAALQEELEKVIHAAFKNKWIATE